MSTIKNLNLLEGISKDVTDKMEYAAGLHKKNADIAIKVIEHKPPVLILQAVQNKNPSGNYFSKKQLVETMHLTFDALLPGTTIHVYPIPFKESPVNVVTPEWIRNKMLTKSKKLKDIAEDTGLDKITLSAIINEASPLSRTMKALFYYYFLATDKSRDYNPGG
jgi:hypothetical protein